ncbi:MAG: hypothetical protein EXR48_06105 [Dehalococcoidia bacterium]|nr:hypothetical protein [Dehalococcoidia bacterium]
MASREEFLHNVREAVRRGQPREAETPSRPAQRPRPDDVQKHAKGVRAQLPLQRQEAIATLLRIAPLQTWEVVRVPTHAEAAQAVARIATGLGAKQAVRSNDPVLTRVPIDTALAAQGVAVYAPAGEASRQDANEYQTLAAGADLGVTGVEWMVAETATAVLLSQQGRPRVASLLPPVHVAVVEADQVVPTLGDALALCHERIAREGWLSHYLNLVSGPSRTGDIEQTIVVGVHGPRQVFLVLIGA